jgi:hypothetical protein
MAIKHVVASPLIVGPIGADLFEIHHLNHQAGRGHFDDLIHLHCAVGQPLAVAPLEFQNPRDDHIDAAKISARHLILV